MSKLNINDIKVGDEYESLSGSTVEILCVGKAAVFYRYEYSGAENSKDFGSFTCYFTKKPKENEDIYYRWFFNHGNGWYITINYYNKNGKRTGGSGYDNWDEIEKKIATEFKPIDKNGDYVEVDK